MRTWQRRTAGLLVTLVGVAFVVVLVVNKLFTVGPAFERMSDGFRPIMKPAPISTLQSDLRRLSAVSAAFSLKGAPMFAQALKMTPEQFTTFMQQRFPAVATGMQQLPGIVTRFDGVVGTLAAEQGRFVSADAIPTSSLPATTVPWGLLAAGILALGIGLVILLRPGRVGAVLALTLGVLLVVAPLVLSLPTKAANADLMNKHLKPVYKAQMLTGATQSLTTVGAMGTQMQQEMLPALGQQLGMDQAQLQSFMQANLPAMATGMQMMPRSMARFDGLIKVFDARLRDYDAITSVAFAPVVWTMIFGGVVCLVGGAWALAFKGRREEFESEVRSYQAAA